ncbi:MAG TPA: PilN domain-containing protein [Candidatus Acidoferrales bacterium]|nr:PilN domain-containing protein [Candidatus Acidoferrales bacterium]
MTPPWVQSLARADFLRSVGLWVSPRRVVLARLSKNLFRLSLVEQQARDLEPSPDGATRRHNLSQAIRSLLPHFDPGRDPVYLCVSHDQAVSCQVFLPQAVAENLSQVLDYEVSRLLPFRRDEIYFDYLAAGKRGDKLAVLLFAAPKRAVDEILEVLAVFGIRPRAVETSATAEANYLLFCQGAGPAPAILLNPQNGNWEMVGVDVQPDGWKRQRHRMVFAYCLPRADWAEASLRELVQAVKADNTRVFTSEAAKDALAAIVGVDAVTDLSGLGRERLNADFQIDHHDLMPAIGVALRGLREARLTLNLLPHPSQREEGRGISRLNVFLLALLLLALLAWGGSYPLRDEYRLSQLRAENQKLVPEVTALQQKESEMTRIKKELAILSSLKARRGEVLQILDELSRIVPASAYLSNLRYRDGTVEIQGSAESASNLVPLLERSVLFKNVGFNAPSNRGRDNRETFSLKAELENAAGGGKKP